MESHRVVILALERLITLDFAIPVEVFGGVSGLPYRLQVCGAGPTVATTAGCPIAPPAGLRALARADTVVVPGFRPHSNTLDAEVVSALRRAHARGARMMSICVGAFALAQAGILDGRRATTHWRHAQELATAYPLIDVDADVLYIDDGNVLTSAGVSSGLDLCLHVVRKDLGVETAQCIAQSLVAAPHRTGNQAQFVTRPVEPDEAGPIAEVCAWATQNLTREISLDDMARQAAMSSRTLTRRFRDATGTSPLQWVTAQRIDEARRLLETTDRPVDEVAEQAGFGTGLNLRTHFRRRFDTTPTAYRRAFQR